MWRNEVIVGKWGMLLWMPLMRIFHYGAYYTSSHRWDLVADFFHHEVGWYIGLKLAQSKELWTVLYSQSL